MEIPWGADISSNGAAAQNMEEKCGEKWQNIYRFYRLNYHENYIMKSKKYNCGKSFIQI